MFNGNFLFNNFFYSTKHFACRGKNILRVQPGIVLIYSKIFSLGVVLNIFETLSLKLFLVVLIFSFFT